MQHVLFAATVAATALAFALLEIQIEGGDGWAGRLPTWRVSNRWTRLAFGPRPVTGYHVYAWIFLLLLLHLPYGLALVRPAWRIEARLLSFICLFWIAEDFLWFVCNPRFGIRRFRRDAIWWHRESWWIMMPREYWIFTAAGIVLYVFSVSQS